MKSKLIKTLIVINGILIPIFIITILGLLISDYIKKSDQEIYKNSEEIAWSKIVQYSYPQEITNSNNYFISKFMSDAIDNKPIETVIGIGEVPENTVNLIFLNNKFEKIGTLLEQDASIKYIDIPNLYSKNSEQIKLTQNIIYIIGTKDTNDDGKIDTNDEHFLYISDLNGKNLNRILDKHIKQYKFINDFKDISITYLEKEKDLAIGVYNIKTNTFTKTTTLSVDKN